MPTIIQNIKSFAAAHKVMATVLAFLAVFGGYKGYKALTSAPAEVRYILAAAQKGILTTSISGSGQVSVSQQLEIKTEVAGDVISVPLQTGKAVGAGALIIQLDTHDAQKTVRDAALNLKSAKLSLKKLKQPADQLTILQAENALAQAKRELEELKEPPEALELLQAENALAQAKESEKQAEDKLKKAYEDGFNAVSNTFLDIPTNITGLDNIIFSKSFSHDYENVSWYLNQIVSSDELPKAVRFSEDVRTSYTASRLAYNDSLNLYRAASRNSDSNTLETLIKETYTFTKRVSDTIKTTKNYIDYIQDSMERHDTTIPSLVNTHQTTLDTYTNDTNSHISALLAITRTIQDEKEAVTNAERSIQEKTESLEELRNGADASDIQTAEEKIREKEESLKDLKAGADKLDIQAQQLTVEQKENALADAKERLSDYSVRTPFAGVIANIAVKKNDSVSSGAAVATLITKQRIAEISLNEVDAAQVQVGQKAILTFDALPDLSITGEVAEMDTIGTISQGVVSYMVKITFDTQDERVKPAMSVSANIITAAKPDVLMVPTSAVKLQGDKSYVEIPAESTQEPGTPFAPVTNGISLPIPPQRRAVETGISNDEFTEIVSGLSEGDVVVTNTISVQTNAARSQTQNGFRFPGLSPPPSPGGGRR